MTPYGMQADTPLCPCHQQRMYWQKMNDRPSGGYWRCREKRKAQDAARWRAYYYERMPTNVRYGPRYLKSRHAKALKRRRERQTQPEAD